MHALNKLRCDPIVAPIHVENGRVAAAAAGLGAADFETERQLETVQLARERRHEPRRALSRNVPVDRSRSSNSSKSAMVSPKA